VSGASAGGCVAVGFGTFSTATVSFTEIWNGNSWQDTTMPLPGMRNEQLATFWCLLRCHQPVRPGRGSNQ